MFTTLSLVTSVKDYVEVVHKLIESDSTYNIQAYSDFGALLSYIFLITKQFFFDFLSLRWIYQIPSLPIIIPNIASAMISEVSVLDGYFHNAFTFLEKPISYGEQNFLFYSLEKFTIGLLNSFFLFLPTSTASLISLRRFVVQGIEAGYLSGLGTLCGSLLWIASILFGWRFLVLPWLSLDILRYALGLILLVKYMWDSYTERRMVLEDLSKYQIFLLTFLLSFTEQTSLFPFLGNLSIGSDATILESFPSNNLMSFLIVHGSYLLGLGIGGLSLLHLTCWFWENPAFRLYTWALSSVKLTARFNYKFLNFTFLYLTMICAMSNVVYFGLDYTLTKPLGFVTNDRLIDQKVLLETSFLNTKASDRNTRMNMGRRGRRERWKKSAQRYRNFDASLYGEGIYDLFTIEDLNYGFDRFWLRRKMRNHDVPFRLFPGPWVRSFKKQLARPRLESFSGPRLEFFRILFEQVYHPIFHEKKPEILSSQNRGSNNFVGNAYTKKLQSSTFTPNSLDQRYEVPSLKNGVDAQKRGLIHEFSTLRKFVRKVNKRIKTSKIALELVDSPALVVSPPFLVPFSSLGGIQKFGLSNRRFDKGGADKTGALATDNAGTNKQRNFLSSRSIYSKKWKEVFSKMDHTLSNFATKQKVLKQQLLFKKPQKLNKVSESISKLGLSSWITNTNSTWNFNKKADFQKQLSKKDQQILKYRAFLIQSDPLLDKQDNSKVLAKNVVNSSLGGNSKELTAFQNVYKPLTLLHPIKFYLHKEQAFQRKFKFYGANIYRNFGISNNSPYFRIMMKKFFYYYKPTLRWERTMRVATLKKIRRKGSRKPLRLNLGTPSLEDGQSQSLTSMIGNLDRESLANNSSLSRSPLKEEVEGVKAGPRLNAQTLPISQSFNGLQKPTHMYSLIGKRATRYRYQIYKDVLQHWYYSPFNRLLLKLDIDAFIRRQPISHFLTKNEEHLLHFRRALLMDHYETLRWYTYMQHYRSMKTRIGGTKSFASRFYNQQFQGTFKKVRHLFSVTPSLAKNGSNQATLKWDQSLYHEYPNNQNFSILNDSILHEELLAAESDIWQEKELGDSVDKNRVEENLKQNENKAFNLKSSFLKNSLVTSSSNEDRKKTLQADDLLNQGKRLIGEYLLQATPIRQELIAHYLQEKNYGELTRFLFKGQKTRGKLSASNQSALLNQEKDYLYTDIEKQELRKNERAEFKKLIQKGVSQSQSSSLFGTGNNLSQNLWIALLKKSQTSVYDRKALKNYLKNKRGTQEKRKKIRQKQLKDRLERIQSWLVQKSSLNNNLEANSSATDFATKLLDSQSISGVMSTGVQKAVKEAIQSQQGFVKSKRPLWGDFQKSQPETIFGSPDFKKSLLEKKLKNSLVNIEILIRKRSSHPKQTLKKLKLLSYKTLFLSKKAIKSVQRVFYETVATKSDNSLQNKPFFLSLFMRRREKSLKLWKRKQYVLAKRKQTRKVLKPLKKQTNRQNFSMARTTDLLEDPSFKFTSSQKKATLSPEKSATSESTRQKREFQDSWNAFNFTQDFQTRRSRRRGSRPTRNRGAIKKPTLNDKLKRQFKILKRYGKKVETKKISQQIIKENLENTFQKRETKQRRTRQRENRFWRRHKKPKYNQNRRKMKKRKRYSIGKLRILTKELKRLESYLKIRKWWWENFLPNFRAQTDTFLELSKNEQIQEKLQSLSLAEILSRDAKAYENLLERVPGEHTLQIGNQDYKPLSLPHALVMREKFPNLAIKSPKNENHFVKNAEDTSSYGHPDPSTKEIGQVQNSVSLLSQNLLNSGILASENNSKVANPSKFMVRVNPIPFYAGWDETLRKFIVTNRLLSRRDAGYQISSNFTSFSDSIAGNNGGDFSQLSSNENSSQSSNTLAKDEKSKNGQKQGYLQDQEFTQYPLKGMNVATTLYWQVPFTTYDPDQFFALGRDGFAPIGWRRFKFQYIKQTMKPIIVKTMTSTHPTRSTLSLPNLRFGIQSSAPKSQIWEGEQSEKKQGNEDQWNETSPLFEKMQLKILNRSKSSKKDSLNAPFQSRIHFSQKRNKRIKRHPRSPVSFPSGPLINEVLPVHYIYVFYKRDRLPRDRYISRRLRRSKDGPTFAMQESLFKLSEWTLRKRAKPRRRYHRKRKDTPKNIGSPKTILRRAFRKSFPSSSFNIGTGNGDLQIQVTRSELERQRPLSKPRLGTGQQLEERLKERYKQRKKNQSIKSKNENLRIRQLRRRVQRQVFRPVWRYGPHPGGFVWPGDYFRLELIKAPKLISLGKSESTLKTEASKTQAALASTSGTQTSAEISGADGLLNLSQKKEIRRKAQKKKKRTIQTWQIQPKKYLLQKHNRKVLKKRLQKSQNHHKINQKLQELSALVSAK